MLCTSFLKAVSMVTLFILPVMGECVNQTIKADLSEDRAISPLIIDKFLTYGIIILLAA